jgi:hypothetical protein
VELVDRLLKEGKIEELQTNGNLSGKKIKASEVEGLTNQKNRAQHLSPDIAVRLNKDIFTISSEIKTGLARKDLINDLTIVKHYRKMQLSTQVEFVWVALFPFEDIRTLRAAKSFEKTYRIMFDDKDVSVIRKEITPWLILVVAVPV